MTAVANATLNGSTILRGNITLPRWGIWTADVQIGTRDKLSGALAGAATIVANGVTFQGTIVAGSDYAGKSLYRVAGGSGGWNKQIPPKAYRGEIGIKLATVVTDAALAAGEPMAPFTAAQQAQVIGKAYARFGGVPGGEAARVLDFVAPESWYVDELGVTHIGVRAPSTLRQPYVLLDKRPDRRFAIIATDTFVGLVPGVTIEGYEIASVRHEITPDAVRTHVWGVIGVNSGARGVTQWLSRQVRAMTARALFLNGTYRYRVTAASVGFVDLQPVATNLGLPALSNVAMQAGAPGASGTPALGSWAYVTFANGDPTDPIVIGFSGFAGAKFVPVISQLDASTEVDVGPSAAAVKLAGGGPAIGRVGDQVQVSFDTTALTALCAEMKCAAPPAPPVPNFVSNITLTGTITAGSAKASSG